MTRSVADVHHLTRYLLGELSEEEQEAVEAGYFGNEEAFRELLVLEDELIDAYVSDELGAPERARFERRFLDSAEGHERVEFARALRRWASSPRKGLRAEGPSVPRRRARTAYRLAGLATAAAMVAGVAWLFSQWAVLRGDLAQLRTKQVDAQAREREWQRQAADLRIRLEQLGEQLARERARPEAPERGPALAQTVTFVLKPGLVRDIGRSQSVTLPPGADWARLELQLPRHEYPSYSVSLQTVEGNTLWSRDALTATPSGRAVIVSLQAGLLAEGHYVLSLQGTSREGRSEVVEEYVFRLVKGR